MYKSLRVSKLANKNIDINQVETLLNDISPESINIINWKDFPTDVKASFKIAHNSENIILQFEVFENEILAQTEADNGKVSKDSCVEFFVSFDNNKHYYNIELSCIGKLLMGYRDIRPNASYASDNVLQSILRQSTLGSENFDLKQGNFSWKLNLIIPYSAFWGDEIKTFDGLEAKVNFYKCGDNLSKKHYLSWSPIGTEKPSFHETNYFGTLVFEE